MNLSLLMHILITRDYIKQNGLMMAPLVVKERFYANSRVGKIFLREKILLIFIGKK